MVSYKFGPFYLNAAERLLLRHSKPVPLTLKALETLLVLVRNNGRVVEKEELMTSVWPEVFVEEANLAQHIFRLRRILGDGHDGRRYIETIPRRGYRFAVAVKEVEDGKTVRAKAADSGGDATRAFSQTETLDKGPAITSLAILPLLNAGGHQSAEYLCDGVTETIINSLSQLPPLRVMSRSAVFRYKNRTIDPQDVGRELGVAAVLAGRVLQLDDRLVIRVELVDTARGWQLWGEQYDCKPSDLLAVQREIAREITAKLRMQLTSKQKR